MKGSPAVSVIMPFWNADKFIGEAITSVLAQGYADWELLLVDDGSGDAGSGLARGYADRHPGRVCYLEHPDHQNRGPSASRNLGLQHARGAYLTFLDADDVFWPQALDRMVALLVAHPEAGAVRGTCQRWYGWTGRPEDSRRDCIPALGLRPNTLFEPPRLLALVQPFGKAASTGMAAVMVRRQVMEQIGGFEDSLRGLGEDQVFYTKIYLGAAVFVTDECWFRYRQHPDSRCAVARRTGDYAALPLLRLWLQEYLSRQGIQDPEIWKAFRRGRLLLYRYPVLYYWLRVLAERLLPGALGRWFKAHW